MLTNSLATYPQDVVIEEGVNYFFDNVIEDIKKNREFLRRLDLFLNKQSDSFFEELIDAVKFESADSLDLFASLHSSDILVNGHKNKDGTWNLEFKLTDKYDFTELVNPFIQEITKKDDEGKEVKYKKLAGMGYFSGWLANDGAYLSQSLGAIAPYKVTIYFSMENYEVKELK